MKKYLTGHIWEWLLCTLMSATMLITFSQGFYIPNKVADSFPLALIVSAVVLFLLLLTGYNRVGMILFPICLVLLGICFFFWLRINEIDIVDKEGSATAIYIYCFAAIIFPLITYLLARGRVGICALFLIGICLFGVIDYLNYDMKVWCCAVFVCCGPALFALRMYRIKSLQGSAFAPEFFKLFRTAVLVGVFALALAFAVYGGIIRPLSPPTATVNLVTKYMRWEILEKTGITDSYTVPDELLSARNKDSTTSSQKQKEEEENEEGREKQNGQEDDSDNQKDTDGIKSSLGDETGGGDGQEVYYRMIRLTEILLDKLPLIIILLCIVIVCIPLLKCYLWKKKIKQAWALTATERAIWMGKYYLTKFRRLGYKRLPWQTEREYVQNMGTTLGNYTEGTLSLSELMEIYIRARYGGEEPTREEDQKLMEFYPVFRNNYRRKKGNINYLLKYFKI